MPFLIGGFGGRSSLAYLATDRDAPAPTESMVERRLPKVGLYGEFGIQNLGNEATLDAFVRALAKYADLIAICGDPQLIDDALDVRAVSIGARRAFPSSTTVIARLLNKATHWLANGMRAIRLTSKQDTLIIAGTGILEDGESMKPWGTPLSVLSFSLAARLQGVPVAFVAVGVSPAVTRLKRWIFTIALRCAAYRSYRDDYSKRSAQLMGVDVTDDPVYGDIVMWSPEPIFPRPTVNPSSVMVGVMQSPGQCVRDADGSLSRYTQVMADFVVWLRHAGYQPWLATGEPTDRQVADAVRDAAFAQDLSGSACDIFEASSLQELQTRLGESAVAVVSRYHHLVAAMLAGTPAISVGYADKSDELMKRHGFSGYVHRMASVDADALKRDFMALVNLRDEAAEEIETARRSYVASLDAQHEDLLSLIGRLNSAMRGA